MQHRPAAWLGERLQTLEHDAASRVYILTTDKRGHRARSVIVSAGVGAFRPKTLPLANASQFEGGGLHCFVKEVNALEGQKVLVGGGDSAVD